MNSKDLQKYIIPNITSKWFTFADLEEVLARFEFEYTEVGRSNEHRPIFEMRIGTGQKRILVWSQMHGNESTGTRAMLDLWNLLHNAPWTQELLHDITLCFIPMLNPDGAQIHSRLTPLGIDLNRDFRCEQTPELRLLKNRVAFFNPDWMFNLHDQRTIFNPKGALMPASLSFLAPSFNKEKDVNKVRQEVMGLIGYISSDLQMLNIGLGRYSDEFYPRSTGDNFTKQGIRCVLFESGHVPNDYNRNKGRRHLLQALLVGIKGIVQNEFTKVNNQKVYAQIPENDTLYYDIILRNVALNKEKTILSDCAIQFKEAIVDNTLIFRPLIKEVGDLKDKLGHKEVDCLGEFIVPLNLDQEVRLELFGLEGPK